MFDPKAELERQSRGVRFIAGFQATYEGGEEVIDPGGNPVLDDDGKPKIGEDGEPVLTVAGPLLDGDKNPILRRRGEPIFDDYDRPVYERFVALWYRPIDGYTAYRVELTKRIEEERSKKRAEVREAATPEEREAADRGDTAAATELMVRANPSTARQEQIQREMASEWFLVGWDDGDRESEGAFTYAKEEPQTAKDFLAVDWIWVALYQKLLEGSLDVMRRAGGDRMAALTAKKKQQPVSRGNSAGESHSARGRPRQRRST